MQIACRPPARERSPACMELVPARLVKELKSKIGKRDLFCIYIYYFSGVSTQELLGGSSFCMLTPLLFQIIVNFIL